MRNSRRKRSKKKNRRSKKKGRFYTKEEQFLSRMASILMLPRNKTKSVFSQRTVSTIRLNNLADDPEKIKKKLMEKGAEMTEVPWAPNTYIVENMDKSQLGKLPEYDRGLFYMQNLASMLPVVILSPKQDENILDMCAAPGSKTTMLAAITGNKANITANEDDLGRIKKLHNVINQFHAKDINVTKNDARDIGQMHSNKYDSVLLDAPCTGEGRIYLQGNKPLRFWNLRRIKTFVKLQEKMILSAYDALKPGGRLIYSTCTLEPDENEGIVSHLLNQRPDASVEEIDLTDRAEFGEYKKYIREGITKWSGKSYDNETKKSIRVVPSSKMEGFYIAKISKPKDQ